MFSVLPVFNCANAVFRAVPGVVEVQLSWLHEVYFFTGTKANREISGAHTKSCRSRILPLASFNEVFDPG